MSDPTRAPRSGIGGKANVASRRHTGCMVNHNRAEAAA